MDILISVTIVLAVTAIFLGITRLLYPTKSPPDPTIEISPKIPAPSPSHLFLPALLYLLTMVLLAILTPLAILFSTQKLPTLIALLTFLTLPSLAYAYLARFNYLVPSQKPPGPKSDHRDIGSSDH